jgi:hypothetical protein
METLLAAGIDGQTPQHPKGDFPSARTDTAVMFMYNAISAKAIELGADVALITSEGHHKGGSSTDAPVRCPMGVLQ